MHRTITTFGLILVVQITFAQSDTLKLSENPISGLGCIEFPPKYPGGYAAMQRLFVASMRYPEVAEKEGIEGKVIIYSICSSCDKLKNLSVLHSYLYLN